MRVAPLAALTCTICLAATGATAREVVKCGATIGSTVISDTKGWTTRSLTFRPLVPATTKVRVPAGQSRCVKLRLAVETVCVGTGEIFCIIRALDNGAEIEPVEETGLVLVDGEGGGGAHSFQWAKRIGPGEHTITIQRRVINPNTLFIIDSFTFDVEVTK